MLSPKNPITNKITTVNLNYRTIVATHFNLREAKVSHRVQSSDTPLNLKETSRDITTQASATITSNKEGHHLANTWNVEVIKAPLSSRSAQDNTSSSDLHHLWSNSNSPANSSNMHPTCKMTGEEITKDSTLLPSSSSSTTTAIESHTSNRKESNRVKSPDRLPYLWSRLLTLNLETISRIMGGGKILKFTLMLNSTTNTCMNKNHITSHIRSPQK